MAASRSDLFKWKRQTKPNSHFASRGSVQDWIKRVQIESDEAAREIFGSGYQGITPLEQVHIDDDALMEAQDLLNMWVHDEDTQTDVNLELEYGSEKWCRSVPTHRTSTAKAKNELDDMVFSIADDGSLEYKNVLKDLSYEDSYGSHRTQKVDVGDVMDDELDEAISVQEVLHGMLNKNVVSNGVLNDLGFEKKKFGDPRTKMELRHQQVKQKSDERRQKLEKTRREVLSRKEAEHQARQHFLREEKAKQTKLKREEQMMQAEMAKIRKLMEEEKKQKQEEMKRQRELEQQAEAYARQEVQEEQRRKEEERQSTKKDQEEMRKMLLKKIEEESAREAKEKLRIMQKYFSSWYSVVAERRVQYGKASALSDWRVKLRAWNAWRAFIQHLQSERETEAITIELMEKHRKEKTAKAFHGKCLKQRCFSAWQLWVQQQEERKQLQDEHEKKARKMEALLQAAANGKLWTERSEVQDEQWNEQKTAKASPAKTSRPNTARQVDEMFTAQESNVPSTVSARSDSEQELSQSSRPSPRKKPRQAWAGRSTSCENLREEKRSKQPVERVPFKRTNSTSALSSDRTKPPRTPLREAEVQSRPKKNYQQLEITDNLLKNSARKTTNNKKDQDTTSSNLTTRSSSSQTTASESLHINIGTDEDTTRNSSHNRPAQFAAGVPFSARSDSSSVMVSRKAQIKSDKVATKPSPLALAMEQRAKERAERKALAEEQRKRAEEQRLEQMKQEQEQREKELLAERQALLEKKREEKRLAKERELEKQKRLEAAKILNDKADQHYHRHLLRKYGFTPWLKLVKMTRDDMNAMAEFSDKKLLAMCFFPWLDITRAERKRKESMADDMYHLILLCRGWRAWRKYRSHLHHMDSLAREHCRRYLMKKYLKVWQEFVTTEQMLTWEKERMAEEHNTMRIQKLALTHWRKFIPLMKEERLRERRREDMRKKVHAWLPDFQVINKDSP